MADPFIPCSLLDLPEAEQVPAAQEAIRINPVNRPTEGAIRALVQRLRQREPKWEKIGLPIPDEEEEAPPTPQAIAMITSKYWGKVVDLGVTFLDTNDSSLKNKILQFMNHWSKYGNIKFRESSNGQVRIARQQGGYWSYLGTDILRMQPGAPTMNLQSWSLNMPESEWYRVVEHETGHTLGFPHEHMRAEIVQQLDPQKTVAYFGRTQGWSPQVVYQQVLTPIDPSTLTATPADEYSIMCYQLPGSITKDGQPIPGGNKINSQDGQFVAGIYPKPGGSGGGGGSGEGPPPAGTTITVPKAGTYRLVEEAAGDEEPWASAKEEGT